MRAVTPRIRTRLLSGAFVALLIFLAACSQQPRESLVPIDNTPAADPTVQVFLLAGAERLPLAPNSTVGPNARFQVSVSDPSLRGISSATYQFGGGAVSEFELDSRGNATIAPVAPLTGSEGSLTIIVTSNSGGSTTREFSFNIDSVPPTITTLLIDDVELVGTQIPPIMLTVGNTGGVQLVISASDTGEFSSVATVILEIDGVVVQSEVGTLNALITSAGMDVGSHPARIYAVDNAGNVSQVYSFTIAVNEPGTIQPPTLEFALPAENAIYRAGAPINVVINSTPGSSEIASVHVEIAGTALDTTDNNRFSGTVPTSAGEHALVAWALGRDGSRSVNITRSIVVSEDAPILEIVSPDAGRTYAPGATIRASLRVEDAGGGIGDVSMTLDGAEPVARNGLSFDFAAPLISDTYELIAVAENASGSTESRQTRAIEVVPEAAPAVSILSPSTGDVFAVGAPVQVELWVESSGSGYNPDSITVSFGGVALEQSEDDPFVFTGNAPPAANANARIVAQAASSGAAPVTSEPTVVNVVVSDDAPALAFTAPAELAEYAPGATVVATVSVADSGGGVAGLEVTLDGAPPVLEQGNNYTFTAPETGGNHLLVARATSTSGDSESVVYRTIFVTPNAAPTVEIVSPADNAVFAVGADITVRLRVTDNGSGIDNDSIEVLAGPANPLVQDDDDPELFTGTVPSTVGPHELVARASSMGLEARTSAPAYRNLIVSDDAPEVSFVAPDAGSTYAPGATVLATISVTDTGGGIGPVDISINDTIDPQNPDPNGRTFRFQAPTEPGVHYLMVEVSSASGGSTNSVRRAIEVVEEAAPQLSIVTPGEMSVHAVDSDIRVRVEIQNAGSGIDYSTLAVTLDGTPMTVDVNDPLVFTGSHSTPGTVELVATVDSLGSEPATATAIRELVISDDAPALSFLSPVPDQSYLPGATIRAVISLADSGGGIGDVSMQLLGGGTPLDGNQVGNTFEFTAPLEHGPYELVAVAESLSGAESSQVSIPIQVVAEAAPIVSFASPDQGTVFAAGTDLQVELFIQDQGSGVGATEVTLEGGPTPLQLDRVIVDEWVFDYTALPDWNQNVSIRAQSVSNGPSPEASEPVFRTIRISNVPPEVTILNEVDAATYLPGAPSFVAIDLEDMGGGIGPVTVTLTPALPGATSIPIAPTIGGNYSFNLPADEGQYVLRVAAQNYATSRETVVTRTLEVIAPAPTVTIVSPEPDHVVGPNDEIVVTIEITDNGGGISEDLISVQLDGTDMLTTDNRTFRITPTAPDPGETDRYRITASAWNSVETRASAEVFQDVYVDATPPVLQVVVPGNGAVLQAGSGENRVHVQAEDHGSDISEIILEVNDGGGWRTYGTYTADESGDILWNPGHGGWLLRAIARDRFGNTAVSDPISSFFTNVDMGLVTTNLVLREPTTRVQTVIPGQLVEFEVNRAAGTDESTVVKTFDFWLDTEILDITVTPDAGNDRHTFSWTAPTEPGTYVFWIWSYFPGILNDPATGPDDWMIEPDWSHIPVVFHVE